MNRHHGQLLHPGEEQGDGVEAGEVPAVVDSGLESLITGSSELEQLGVVRCCRLVDVTLPLDNFNVPGSLSGSNNTQFSLSSPG